VDIFLNLILPTRWGYIRSGGTVVCIYSTVSRVVGQYVDIPSGKKGGGYMYIASGGHRVGDNQSIETWWYMNIPSGGNKWG
jgi:hypothetical protein